MGRDTLGVDLSVNPLAAIKRIGILRDGASAQYGSDAIAGDEVDALLAAAGVSGSKRVQYLRNGLDVRTRGVDFRAGYDWESPWGTVQFSAGLNVSDRKVIGEADSPAAVSVLGDDVELVDSAWQNQLEECTPDSKLHLEARWADQPLNNVLPYSAFSSYGFNGRYAYLRLTLDFSSR